MSPIVKHNQRFLTHVNEQTRWRCIDGRVTYLHCVCVCVCVASIRLFMVCCLCAIAYITLVICAGLLVTLPCHWMVHSMTDTQLYIHCIGSGVILSGLLASIAEPILFSVFHSHIRFGVFA